MNNIYYKISVVQAYINHYTGKTVQIQTPRTQQELFMLEQAYQKAINTLDVISLFH